MGPSVAEVWTNMVLQMSEVNWDESHYIGTTGTAQGENKVQKGGYTEDPTEGSCPNWEFVTRGDENI